MLLDHFVMVRIHARQPSRKWLTVSDLSSLNERKKKSQSLRLHHSCTVLALIICPYDCHIRDPVQIDAWVFFSLNLNK
jgi:hypothetical protein